MNTNIHKDVDLLVHTVRYFDSLSRDLQQVGADYPKIHGYIRKWISHMKCFSVSQEILDDSNILGVIADLYKWIVGTSASSGRVPMDIRLDVEWLRRKWRKGDWELTDCLRGVRVDPLHFGRSLDRGWRWRRNSQQFGNNGLISGETWIYQVCLLRDGGHGDTEAGISGIKGQGATSLVLSDPENMESYADIDQGDKVKYVSNPGTRAAPHPRTEFLIASYKHHVLQQTIKREEKDQDEQDRQNVDAEDRPVRLFRSWRLPEINPLRPKEGFRYDGLYDVVESQLIDPARSLYRFTLERKANQGEIRVDQPDDQMCLLYYQTRQVQKAQRKKFLRDQSRGLISGQ
jgi:SAD/SRA domain